MAWHLRNADSVAAYKRIEVEMSNWKQIIVEEEPDWQEWHREIMSPIFGQMMLKVWESLDGVYRVSATTTQGVRHTAKLIGKDIEESKERALIWAAISFNARSE